MESRGCTTQAIVNGNLQILQYFLREVASDFLFLCRHLLEFYNEAWSSFDQLNSGCGTSPTFPLVPLAFEYLPLMQVYTFFWGRLYFPNVMQSWPSERAQKKQLIPLYIIISVSFL